MARTEAMARHLYNRLVEEGHTHTVAWQESLGSLSPQVLSTMTLSQQIEFYETTADRIAAQLRDPARRRSGRDRDRRAKHSQQEGLRARLTVGPSPCQTGDHL